MPQGTVPHDRGALVCVTPVGFHTLPYALRIVAVFGEGCRAAGVKSLTPPSDEGDGYDVDGDDHHHKRQPCDAQEYPVRRANDN